MDYVDERSPDPQTFACEEKANPTGARRPTLALHLGAPRPLPTPPDTWRPHIRNRSSSTSAACRDARAKNGRAGDPGLDFVHADMTTATRGCFTMITRPPLRQEQAGK